MTIGKSCVKDDKFKIYTPKEYAGHLDLFKTEITKATSGMLDTQYKTVIYANVLMTNEVKC